MQQAHNWDVLSASSFKLNYFKFAQNSTLVEQFSTKLHYVTYHMSTVFIVTFRVSQIKINSLWSTSLLIHMNLRRNKTRTVRIKQSMLLSKNNKYYIIWVCVCSLRYPACKTHKPYYIFICGIYVLGVSDFVLKWSEVKWSYGEVLVDKGTMYDRVTVHWGYLIVLWLFHVVCILCCGCFNLFCTVLVCVCVDFVICGCVYVWIL